jgi:GAF domain-containing protein
MAQPWPRTDYERVLRQQESFIVTPDVQASAYNPDTKLYAALDIRSAAQVSMEREGQLIGVLTVCTLGETRNFSEDELILLKGLADQAAQAIANARLLEAVREERALLAQRVTERTRELSAANAELSRAARVKDEFLAGILLP